MVRYLLVCFLAVSLPAQGATFATADGPVLVRNWGYQLQGTGGPLTAAPLAAAPHDLLVIDFAGYGDEESKFSPQQIADIKHSVGGDGKRKVVTAYVSIGEASEFRTYWQPSWTQNGTADSPLTATAPSWLGPVNPDWDESRKVRYWDPDWRDVVFNDAKTGWLDQVVTQGFDGAYLDIVDAYYFWGNEVAGADRHAGDPADGQDAARRMAQFVVAMTEHARETNPHFFVIPQNGEFLLSDLRFGPNPATGDAELRTAYLDAIAAIGIEDTYYRGNADENNALAVDADKVEVLKEDFLAAGKPALVVDYIDQVAKVSGFFGRARADGFIPYAAPRRDLDRLATPAPSVAGDFDGDGAVGAADYSLWRATYNSNALLDADANEDGLVDAADYTLWRDASTIPALAVPEPATGALAAALLLVRRRRPS